MKKRLMTGIMCAAMLSLAVAGVHAEDNEKITVTSEDKVFTITLPNSSWKEIISDESTDVFSDGDCAITLDVYRAGEALPAVTIANNNYPAVYETFASNQQYVYVAVGLISDASKESYDAIHDAIDSITADLSKLQNVDISHTSDASAYSIQDTSYTAYVVADQLNIRNSSDKEAGVLATLSYGDAIEVSGTVLKGGVNSGWVRVNIGGQDGYVFAEFLSTTQPSGSSASTAEKKTDGTVTKTGDVIYLSGSWYNGSTIYKYSDGVWRNDWGTVFTCPDGVTWYDADGYTYKDQDSCQMFYAADGSGVQVYKDRATSDLYDADGETYYRDGNGNLVAASTGQILYNNWSYDQIEDLETADTIYSGDTVDFYAYDAYDNGYSLSGIDDYHHYIDEYGTTYTYNVYDGFFYGADGSVLCVDSSAF